MYAWIWLAISGPASYMLFSLRGSVSRIVADKATPDVVLHLNGMKNMRAIAFDPAENYFYWLDGKAKEVRRTKENHSKVR